MVEAVTAEAEAEAACEIAVPGGDAGVPRRRKTAGSGDGREYLGACAASSASPGRDPALPFLLDGLSRLEYRGYDSSGVALVDGDRVWVRRRAGKLAELAGAVGDAPHGHGRHRPHPVGHPRRPDRAQRPPPHRLHRRAGPGPQRDHREPRRAGRRAGGRRPRAALGDRHRGPGPPDRGGHGRRDGPGRRRPGRARPGRGLVRRGRRPRRRPRADRRRPPVVAAGRRAHRRRRPAWPPTSRPCWPPPARSTCSTTTRWSRSGPGALRVTTLDGDEVTPEPPPRRGDLETAEKGGYPDFMLKEIHEQPRAVRETLRGRTEGDRLILGELQLSDDELRAVDKVFIVGCGTSYHAGLVAKYAIEHWARLPTEIDVASEFRYRDPVLDAQTPGRRREPVGREPRHHGGVPVRPVGHQQGQGPGRLQRGRLVDGPRGRRRPLHPGRPRDRRGRHQDPRGPDRGHGAPGPAPGPGAGRCCTPRRLARQVEALHALPARSTEVLARVRRDVRGRRRATSTPATSSSSAAASATRSPSRAR